MCKKKKAETLLTMVHIFKAMVFPVVICRCESWAIKKAEHQRIVAFRIVVLVKTLESILDRKEIKPVSPTVISPEYSLEGLMLTMKLQFFGHLMQRTDSLEKDPDAGKD